MALNVSAVTVTVVCLLTLAACRDQRTTPARGGTVSGEALFQQHCAMCHPDGGNTLYPQKGLQRDSLAANGITTVQGIIDKMRRPGPRMKRFDPAEIDETEARRIAEYILDRFR